MPEFDIDEENMGPGFQRPTYLTESYKMGMGVEKLLALRRVFL